MPYASTLSRANFNKFNMVTETSSQSFTSEEYVNLHAHLIALAESIRITRICQNTYFKTKEYRHLVRAKEAEVYTDKMLKIVSAFEKDINRQVAERADDIIRFVTGKLV